MDINKVIGILNTANRRFFHALYCGICCWLGAFAIFAHFFDHILPLDLITRVFSWLGIGTTWTEAAATWIINRSDIINIVCILIMISLAFAASYEANDYESRTMPTFLLALCLDAQAGKGVRTAAIIIVVALVLWLLGLLAQWQDGKYGLGPGPVVLVGEHGRQFLKTLCLAMTLAILSPLLWPLGTPPKTSE